MHMRPSRILFDCRSKSLKTMGLSFHVEDAPRRGARGRGPRARGVEWGRGERSAEGRLVRCAHIGRAPKGRVFREPAAAKDRRGELSATEAQLVPYLSALRIMDALRLGPGVWAGVRGWRR